MVMVFLKPHLCAQVVVLHTGIHDRPHRRTAGDPDGLEAPSHALGVALRGNGGAAADERVFGEDLMV